MGGGVEGIFGECVGELRCGGGHCGKSFCGNVAMCSKASGWIQFRREDAGVRSWFEWELFATSLIGDDGTWNAQLTFCLIEFRCCLTTRSSLSRLLHRAGSCSHLTTRQPSPSVPPTTHPAPSQTPSPLTSPPQSSQLPPHYPHPKS